MKYLNYADHQAPHWHRMDNNPDGSNTFFYIDDQGIEKQLILGQRSKISSRDYLKSVDIHAPNWYKMDSNPDGSNTFFYIDDQGIEKQITL